MGLNELQVEVLRWVADGSPERDWPDWTHRATAKALQSRGLVKVRGHGAAWTAVITDRGRRLLDGEEDAPARGAEPSLAGRRARSDEAGAAKRQADAPAPPVNVGPTGLVTELESAVGSVVRVSDPDPATRAAYRRALAAITPALVPDGKRVTYSGRDHGDLVIRFVEDRDAEAPGPPVVVPDEVDEARPLLTWLAGQPERLDVAPDSRERAFRIIQGIEDALTALGHTVSRPRTTPPTDEQPYERRATLTHAIGRPVGPVTFEVTVGEQILQVDLFEEKSKAHTVPDEAAAKLKYEWQRATPVQTWQFNGRLALRIHDHTANHGWADRQRWTLESRLPRFAAALIEVAAARSEAYRQAVEAKRGRRREWEEAVPKARDDYLRHLNRGRLTNQLEAFAKTQQLRDYADAVAGRAETLAGAEQESALAWAEWIRADADLHDPILQSGALHFAEPADIRSWDLDKFMPRGWSVTRPPDANDDAGR